MFNMTSLSNFGTIEYRGLSLDTPRSLLIDTINSLLWIKRYITTHSTYRGINWVHLRTAVLKDFPLRQHVRDADFISLALLHESTNYMTTVTSPKLESLLYLGANTWRIDVADIVEGYEYTPSDITMSYLLREYPKVFSKKENKSAKPVKRRTPSHEWIEVTTAFAAEPILFNLDNPDQ